MYSYKTGIPQIDDVCGGFSLVNNVPVYFPITSTFDVDVNPWPTGIVSGQSMGINVGAMFSNPLALIGSSGLLCLTDATGEPQWYAFGLTSAGQFSAVLAPPDGSFTAYFADLPTSTATATLGDLDFTDDVGLAYARISDATLGGAIPTANYPIDPATGVASPNGGYGFSHVQAMDYVDANGNGGWDPGESITHVVLQRNMSGIVSLSTLLGTYGGSVQTYLTRDYSNALSALNGTDSGLLASTATIASLVTALQSSGPSIATVVAAGPFPVLNDVSGAPDFNSVYMGAPRFFAWLTLAPQGAQAVDGNATMTSEGSLYWWLATLLSTFGL